MKQTLKLMIVAGEASGDGHAAKLVAAIRKERPDANIEFFGAAGERMRAAGVEAVVMSDELSIVGLAEIGRALPMFLRAFRDLKRAAMEKSPDAIILVDFPDFNLKLAKSLRRHGLKIIYYISPQLWAWRKYRVAAVRKYVDLMITILPFEKDWYARHDVTNVEYVGSPLAREVHAERSKEEFVRDHGLDPSEPIIALLPGSRHKEIVRILPVMIEAVERIRIINPAAQFIVPVSSEKNRLDVEGISSRTPLKIVVNETYDAINASDAAAVASGTATLETGIIGTPMVVVYKTSTINFRLLEPIIDVPHYGLINLIAKKRLATELIQSNFTGETLAAEILNLLQTDENARMRAQLKAVTDELGHGGASQRAAKAVLRTIDETSVK